MTKARDLGDNAQNTKPKVVDAKADLIVGTGADAANRLAVGANRTVLTADSAEVTGLKWAAPDPLTTKGDLFTYSTIEDRLPVGANNTVLTADSTTATGLKWGTLPSPSSTKTFSLLNTGGTALTGASTITVSGLSGYDQFFVFLDSASSVSASSVMAIRFNGDTGNNYSRFELITVGSSTHAATDAQGFSGFAESSFFFGKTSTNAGSTVSGSMLVLGCNTSGVKIAQGGGGGSASTGNGQEIRLSGGIYQSSSVISSISIVSFSGNFDAGTVYIYGAQ